MINNKKVLAVVTARANSQGLPGKNYKDLLGTPLFAWSVMSAIRSHHVDAVIISSNCEHVKKISLKLISEINDESDTRFKDLVRCKNVNFLQRPDEYATGISKNEDSLIHAYNYAKEHLGIDADIIVNLQPTSPIRDNEGSHLIDECLEKMDNEKADSLFTASVHTPFYFKVVDGVVTAEWDYKNRPMRQEIAAEEFLWHDDGNVYITSVPLLLSERCRLGGKMSVYELTHAQSLQIDTEEDFKIIEGFLKEEVSRYRI
jgi:N-acylneuraminate cytidylyltransferase